jgi:NTP pyrophosphatase (non-canonical NTP hydrolase)
MKFEDFKTNVQQWATERGIYEHSTATAQALKAVSEVGELCDAVIKNDRAALIDAIGDVAVCLVNVAKLADTDFYVHPVKNQTDKPTVVLAASTSKCVSDLALMVSVFDDSRYVMREVGAYNSLEGQMGYSFGHLQMIAKSAHLDFEACCESAWLEIKNRKGRMSASGAFIKE